MTRIRSWAPGAPKGYDAGWGGASRGRGFTPHGGVCESLRGGVRTRERARPRKRERESVCVCVREREREREKERVPTRCASGETVHFYQPVAPTIHIGSTAAVVPITERNTALFPAKETYYVSKRDLLHEYKRPTSHYRAQHSIVSCNWNSTTRSDKGHIWAYKREGEGGGGEREIERER